MLLAGSLLLACGIVLFAFALPGIYRSDERGRAVRYGRFVSGVLLILVGLALLPSFAAGGIT